MIEVESEYHITKHDKISCEHELEIHRYKPHRIELYCPKCKVLFHLNYEKDLIFILKMWMDGT